MSAGAERRAVPATRAWNQVIGRYSRAVRVGNVIETTAIADVDDSAEVRAPGDLYAQTKAALENIVDALEQLGATRTDVIKTRLFITDLDNWEEAGRAHREMFDDVQPASGFIGVVGFPNPDVLVEVEVTAVVSG